MKQTIRKNRKWAGYVLYAVVLTGWLIYNRFPAEALETYVKAKVMETNPEMVLSTEKVDLSFPLSLKFINPHVFHKGMHQTPVFVAKGFSLTPQIGAFIRGEPAYQFHARAYGGVIKGRIWFKHRDMSGPFDAAVTLKDLNLQEHACISPLLNREVSGSLSGRIRYNGPPDLWMDGTGTADLNITSARMNLLQPLLGFQSLTFDQISTKAALKAKTMNLEHVDFDGPAVKGSLAGDISLKHDVYTSRLNLRGRIEPLKGVLDGIKDGSKGLKFLQQSLSKLKRTFVIQGTLESPVFRFISH
ncbi:MAG: type II secretion system protein GspN [Desulfatiglandaceae bacterium]